MRSVIMPMPKFVGPPPNWLRLLGDDDSGSAALDVSWNGVDWQRMATTGPAFAPES